MKDNILFNQMSLEQLIDAFSIKIDNITTKFDQITNQLKKVDDNHEIWVSDAQSSFKQKKDIYVKQLPETIAELNKQLELLREAKTKFHETEENIKSNIGEAINDLN